MDKFTKTTEIDISAMNDVMEQATPKKNKAGKIIAIILSLVAAVIIWIYVSDTSPEIFDKDFEVKCGEVELVVNVETTNSLLADIKRVEVSLENGEYVAKFFGREDKEISEEKLSEHELEYTVKEKTKE